MAGLTRQFLTDLGIELDDEHYAVLAEHFDTTLHDRVVDEVVAELTPEQAHQLAELQAGSDDQLYAWLQQHVPDLSDIISDEIEILLGEIAEDSDKI